MKKQDGFENQIMIVVPPELYLNADALTRQLYVTAIGYFPEASEHYVARKNGEDSNILIICAGGCGWVETGNIRHELMKGDAIIIPEDSPHRYGSSENGWWEIYWIHYGGILGRAVGDRISRSGSGVSFPLSPGDESRRLFSQICAGLQDGAGPLNYELTCSRFWHLAGSLSRDRNSAAASNSGTVKECIALMEERISSSLSLNELSSRVSMTPQYLCRLFRKSTGHPPMEHYTQMKIQRACSMLDLTDARINEICRQFGYDDPYYFTRTFKRIMGMSPRDYRRRQTFKSAVSGGPNILSENRT